MCPSTEFCERMERNKTHFRDEGTASNAPYLQPNVVHGRGRAVLQGHGQEHEDEKRDDSQRVRRPRPLAQEKLRADHVVVHQQLSID